MTEPEKLAWCAGLFEGEGSITLRTDNHLRLNASLGSTDLDVLTRFHEYMGIGKILGPYSYKNSNYKQYWQWKIYSINDFMVFTSKIGHMLGERRSARLQEVLSKRFLKEPLL